MERASDRSWTCPICRRTHRAVTLRVGERASCAVCGTTLARHQPSSDAALAWTLTAVILAVPALQLPLVSVAKFGNDHASRIWTGIVALWQHSMPLLAVWVALCGVVVPLVLLGTILALLLPRERPSESARPRAVMRWARALSHWSMPEVHVLAILVAFVKIGSLVHVTVRAGLWFYGAMAVALLLAWRSTNALEARP